MAQPLVVNQIVQSKVVCYDLESDQLGLNVTYWKVTAITPGTTDQDFANNRAAAHAVAYKGWMSSRSQYEGVVVKIISPSPFPEVTSNSGFGAGTAGADQLPTQVTGLVRIKTNDTNERTAGKIYNPKGRLYIPFPSLMWANEQGKMNIGGYDQLTAVQGTYPLTVTISGAGIGGTLKLVVRSPGIPVGIFDATALQHPQLFATQRRRGDFGKINANPFA